MSQLFVSVPNQENIRAASISGNIRIRIRIHFVKYEKGSGKSTIRYASDPFPPLPAVPAPQRAASYRLRPTTRAAEA